MVFILVFKVFKLFKMNEKCIPWTEENIQYFCMYFCVHFGFLFVSCKKILLVITYNMYRTICTHMHA